MARPVTGVIIVYLALVSGLAFGASTYEEGVAELSKSIVADAAKFKKQKLAAVDFTDLSGNVTELGRFLAEELSVSLVITGSGLEIVDRTQLNKILQEQHLSFTGVIEPAAVKKVGQIAGVDALIAGTITDLGDTIRLTLKIIATDTGSLVSAARTTIPKTGTVARLMEREVAVPRMPGQDRPEVQKEPSVKWDAPQKGRVVDLGTLQAVIEKLQVVGKEGLMVYIAFTNKTEKDAWLIPGHPQAEKIVANDELGNAYGLKKATGMGRTQNSDTIYS